MNIQLSLVGQRPDCPEIPNMARYLKAEKGWTVDYEIKDGDVCEILFKEVNDTAEVMDDFDAAWEAAGRFEEMYFSVASTIKRTMKQ